MTAQNVIRLPLDITVFDRLNAHQRNANIAAERAERRQAALAVIRNSGWHTRQDIEDAWVLLSIYGTDHERQVARDKIAQMETWAAEVARPETPADVARRFAHRWPEIVSWGAFVAVALLWATGWLA